MCDWMKMFEGSLQVRPPLSDEQISQIPARRGVMLLLAESDEPILLTTAADIRSRMRRRLTAGDPDERKKTADLRGITRKLLWELTHSHFETDLAFFERARAIHPKRYTSLVAWKPAWFVHVNPDEEYPHFARSRDVFAEVGRYFGPFPSGREAERFVNDIEDAFDLCRHVQCLRQAPHGQRCAYAQIGKCLSPCDGATPMDEYRRVVAEAADFAAGRRTGRIDRLTEQMSRAAGELEFEKAAAIKSRLDRLGEFDRPAWEHVAPAERFQWIAIQPGGHRHEAKVFLIDRGFIKRDTPLKYPLQTRQLQRVVRRMRDHVDLDRTVGEYERWLIGLTARYLFSGDEKRRGVFLRWSDEVTAESLARAVAESDETLGLGARRTGRKSESDRNEAEDDGPTAGDESSEEAGRRYNDRRE